MKICRKCGYNSIYTMLLFADDELGIVIQKLKCPSCNTEYEIEEYYNLISGGRISLHGEYNQDNVNVYASNTSQNAPQSTIISNV